MPEIAMDALADYKVAQVATCGRLGHLHVLEVLMYEGVEVDDGVQLLSLN